MYSSSLNVDSCSATNSVVTAPWLTSTKVAARPDFRFHQLSARVVSLTPRELSLLRVLLIHRGRARTRQQLLDEAWGSDEYIDPRTVDVHVRWLRQKIEPDAEHPQYIETIRGIGYRFSK